MQATTAIAQHLNISESLITEVQEWAHVLWVKIKGIGARFVSKKVLPVKVYAVIAVTLDGKEKVEFVTNNRREALGYTRDGLDQYFQGFVPMGLVAKFKLEETIDIKTMRCWKANLSLQTPAPCTTFGVSPYQFLLEQSRKLGGYIYQAEN